MQNTREIFSLLKVFHVFKFHMACSIRDFFNDEIFPIYGISLFLPWLVATSGLIGLLCFAITDSPSTSS